MLKDLKADGRLELPEFGRQIEAIGHVESQVGETSGAPPRFGHHLRIVVHPCHLPCAVTGEQLRPVAVAAADIDRPLALHEGQGKLVTLHMLVPEAFPLRYSWMDPFTHSFGVALRG